MVGLPEGWEAQPEPDGSLRVRPQTRSRRNAGKASIAGGLLFLGFSALIVLAVHLKGPRHIVIWSLFFLVLGVVLIVQGLSEVFTREEWLVGHDFLAVRRRLGRFGRSSSYRGATLELIYSAGCEEVDWGVRVAYQWRGLYVRDRCGKRCLRTSGTVYYPPAENLRAVAEFLSEQTGWPLVLPQERGPRLRRSSPRRKRKAQATRQHTP